MLNKRAFLLRNILLDSVPQMEYLSAKCVFIKQHVSRTTINMFHLGLIKDLAFALGGWVISDKLKDPGAKLEAVKDEMIALSKKYNDDSERVKAGIIQLDEAIQEQKGDLEKLQEALSGVESDMRMLRELAIRRSYWSFSACVVAVIALVLAIVSLTR